LSIRCLEYRDRSRQSAHLLVAAPSTWPILLRETMDRRATTYIDRHVYIFVISDLELISGERYRNDATRQTGVFIHDIYIYIFLLIGILTTVVATWTSHPLSQDAIIYIYIHI
jgi:hypothetical protein